jgi:Domain of unknown function (DUF4397)
MRKWIGICCVAALIATAAGVGAKNQETRGIGKVRVIHNFASDTIPQPAAVDVRFGKNADPAANTDKLKGIKYGTISKYLRLKSPVTAGVFLAGTTTQLFSANLGTVRKQRLTLLAEPDSSAGGAFIVQVLDDSTREPKRKKANVRVIHGIPSAAANDVKVGVVGVGCITDALSYPDTAVIEVDAGTYTLGVFPPSDPTCAGSPLAGLTAEQELNSRSVYTAIARIKPGDPAAFQLEVVRDF